MFQEELFKIVQQYQKIGTPNFVIKNILKEYLQYPVLSFIYNNSNYNKMIFTGGSCLRICFGLPRLSEDLDFDLRARYYNQLNLKKMAQEIECFFKNNFLLKIQTKTQDKKRIYLKFPILRDLGLAQLGESDFLYVKIEPSKSVFLRPQIEVQAISKFGFNFIVRRYNLEYLMTGKIEAIFSRDWFRGKQNQINIKGRDFYDLYWYLDKGIQPNFKEIKRTLNIKNKQELERKLLEKIEKDVTARKLSYDLKNFFLDQNYIKIFCQNYKKLIQQAIIKYADRKN